MQGLILLVLKFGLLAMLWLFIFLTLRSLHRDSQLSGTAKAPSARRGWRMSRRKAKKSGPPTLLVTNGPLAGLTLDLSQYHDLTLGRSADCTLSFADDFASGNHARMTRRGHSWYIEDLDSRNGTFVNEQQIYQPEQVSREDTIRVGRTVLQLQ